MISQRVQLAASIIEYSHSHMSHYHIYCSAELLWRTASLLVLERCQTSLINLWLQQLIPGVEVKVLLKRLNVNAAGHSHAPQQLIF